jgi:hypothetical protein
MVGHALGAGEGLCVRPSNRGRPTTGCVVVSAVGAIVGAETGFPVGTDEENVGAGINDCDAAAEGVTVGAVQTGTWSVDEISVGWLVTCRLNAEIGCAVGCREGCLEGHDVGSEVGWAAGCPLGYEVG